MNRKTILIACVALTLIAGTVHAGLFSFLRARRARPSVVTVQPTPTQTEQQAPEQQTQHRAPNTENDPSTDVPELARQEILRRGNLVERVGPGWSDSPVSQVMGPPADDSHKWFISVIVREGCPACERLLADLARSPELTAYVDVEDHTQSWAHFNVFHADDETQSWRWRDVRIGGYPTIIVQPPRNGAYGDPHTVVLQKTGYDGDAAKLAASIRDAILQYVQQKVRPRQFPRQGMRQSDAEEPTEPPVFRYEPPFTPPPAPPEIPRQPGPTVPFDIPPTPAQPQQPTGIDLVSLLISALGALLGGGALTNILLIVLAVMIGVREFRKATGQKLLLDEEAFSRIVEKIRDLIDNDLNKKSDSDGG